MQLLLNGLLDFYGTKYSCSTLSADVHEGIWLLSKIFHKKEWGGGGRLWKRGVYLVSYAHSSSYNWIKS